MVSKEILKKLLIAGPRQCVPKITNPSFSFNLLKEEEIAMYGSFII